MTTHAHTARITGGARRALGPGPVKRGVSEKTPHRWYTPRGKPWLTYCWRCGLMALKNAATAKAIRAGCFREEDVVLDVTG